LREIKDLYSKVHSTFAEKKKKSFTSNKYYIKIGYINKDNPFYIQDSFVVLN